jgi:hypothetical protein
MDKNKESVAKLNKLITGIWENDNLRFSFNGESIDEGTVTVRNKKTEDGFGVNFRFHLKNNIATLQFLNKDETNPYFENFPLFLLNEHRLTMQNREVSITVNKIVYANQKSHF